MVSLRIFSRGRFWLGCLLILFLLAALIFLWGWWRWEQLSHPSSDSRRAWQLAPADSAFFYLVPNVPKFYSRFFRYHAETLSSPTLVAARKSRDQSPLLAPPPTMPIPPALLDLMKHSGKVALFDYFTALLPPSAGDKHFRFLIGGQCLNPWLAEASFVRSSHERDGYAWKKTTRDGLGCRMIEQPNQTLWLLTSADWLLISNDWAALKEAAEAARGEREDLLGSQPAFQRSRDHSLREALVWIYANPEEIATAADAMGSTPLAEALSWITPGLLAASWSWHSLGPRSVGYDLVSFTLSESALKAAQDALPPLDAARFDAALPDAVWAMAASADLDKLASWPILEPSRVEALASTQQDLSFHQITHPSQSASDDSQPPAWITEAGTMTGAEKPFFEARINYRAIVQATLDEVQTNWAEWQQVLKDKGWPAPDSAPNLEVGHYFARIRVTAGLEEGHLALYNAVQLGNSGSTLLTSLVTLTTQLAPEAMQSRMETARAPFARLGDQDAPPWANAMDITLLSGLFLSPIFMHDHGGNMPIDLIMLEALANGLEP